MHKMFLSASAILLTLWLVLTLSPISEAQISGNPTRLPRLTVGPGATSVQNLTVNGTCTGCGGGGQNLLVAWGHIESDGTLLGASVGLDTPTNPATGVYQVDFTVGFASAPACTVSARAAGPFIASITNVDATTVGITVENAAGVDTDTDFSISCLGELSI